MISTLSTTMLNASVLKREPDSAPSFLKSGLLVALLAAAMSSSIAPRVQAEQVSTQLALDDTASQRLGVEFQSSGQPGALILAEVPGVTSVLPQHATQFVLPFETRVEEWQSAAGTHQNAGEPLVSLHSHDALAFFRSLERDRSKVKICNERLEFMQQRNQSGLNSRWELQDQALLCQQQEDDLIARLQMLRHLPADWQNRQQAEVTLRSDTSGWLMQSHFQTGDMAPAHTSLASFWPDDQLAVEISLPAHLATRLETGMSINLQRSASQTSDWEEPVEMTLTQRSGHPDSAGLYQLWLKPIDDATELTPGERWQVAVPSSEQGWVIPSSARIRADGQSWVFVKTANGVEVQAIEPLAEGSHGLLLPQQSFSQPPTVVIKGTAALTSFWLATEEGGE